MEDVMGTEKQEACQLFIEQEIQEGLAIGKTPSQIGKELVPWLQKLFEVAIPPRTIEQRARRQKDATFVAIEPNSTETNPPKFLVNTQDEILHKASEIRKEKKEKQIQFQQEKRQEIIEQPIPENKYQTIVIDPPWPTEKIIRDERPNQDIFNYPTMSIEEITNFKTSEFAADNCHIYMWSTHKFLPVAFLILDSWGFKYQCLMTWRKNVGMTPFSWMYSTEHILFGRKGNLPLLKMGVRLDFDAKVREHSRKPEIFYETVKSVSPGPRIDIFSREKHEGFDQFGNEQERF